MKNTFIQVIAIANFYFELKNGSIKTALLGVMLMLFTNSTLAQNAPWAEVVNVTQICGDNLGSIEMGLLVHTDSYTYYWTHGPTDLLITDLEAGIYTFVVVNSQGCAQTFDVEIIGATNCTLEYEVFDYSGEGSSFRCFRDITIRVYSDGVELDESALSIAWSDGYPQPTLNRTIYLQYGLSQTLCVSILILNGDNLCCILEQCFEIVGTEKRCHKTENPIIINEYNRENNGKEQFVELLVIGNGECSEVFDLRGYSVDDNNGELILGNDFVTAFNAEGIGVNQGYLTFKSIDTWGFVPNGSLILIYDRENIPNRMPDDDPNDANGDGVYVLSADDSNYFLGKSGTWNNGSQTIDYEGTFVPPSWDLINLSTNADGMQVRHPDGSYCHGVSLGTSSLSEENTFPLWITDNSSTDCNCRFMKENYLLKEDFDCHGEANEYTPGLPNSPENEAFIYSIVDCDDEVENRSNENINDNETDAENELNAYPNPFNNELYITFIAESKGEVELAIFSMDGSLFLKEKWLCGKGQNTQRLSSTSQLPSGILLLQMIFPSGERKEIRVAQMH